MRNKIRVYVSYNDEVKKYYYWDFTIVDELPKIDTTKQYNGELVEIKEIEKDCDQPSEDARHYDCYELKRIDYEYYLDEKGSDIDRYTYYEYIAIKHNDD